VVGTTSSDGILVTLEISKHLLNIHYQPTIQADCKNTDRFSRASLAACGYINHYATTILKAHTNTNMDISFNHTRVKLV